MATAVKNSTDTNSATSANTRLIVASVIGAVYVGACVVIVSMLVPLLWKNALVFVGFLSATDVVLSPFQLAGQAFLQLFCAIGLVVLGVALAGPNPPEGTRAGVFTILATLLLTYLLTIWVGGLQQKYAFKGKVDMVGLGVMVAFGLGLLGAAIYYGFVRGEFAKFAVKFENQGWFSAHAYKSSQGRLVRRLTILGLVFLFGAGIWSLSSHNMLVGQWAPRIPFTGGRYLPLLHDIKYTVPLSLAVAGLWVAWRTVNFPTFADFLIATEAEMNKVSWTNRRRLMQDTIVVLVTVLLFTVFLLAIDSFWGLAVTKLGVVPDVPPKVSTDNPQELPW